MRWRSLGGFLVLLILLLVGWGIQSYIAGRIVATETFPSLTELQERSFDLFLENNKLLTSLALLMIAGVGIFVQLLVKGELRIDVNSLPRWLLLVSMLFAALSIYCGYLASENLSTLLRHDAYDITLDAVSIPKQLQFYFFLGSIFCFGMFFSAVLYQRVTTNSSRR